MGHVLLLHTTWLTCVCAREGYVNLMFVPTAPRSDSPTQVSMYKDEIFIVGKPPILLHSKDSGKSWERVPLSPKVGYQKTSVQQRSSCGHRDDVHGVTLKTCFIR